MKLLDVLNSPWAIQPEKLKEIRDIYVTHLRGDKIDIRFIEAQIGKPLRNTQERVTVQDGVAIVPIEGVLAKRMNLFTKISGGASTQIIQQDIETSLASHEVNGIILAIDSPGGTVDGTQELARFIREASEVKPIVAFSDGVMASAAFWIGAAANKAFISGGTVGVGSVGVVATHTDVSRMEEKMGIKTTEIVAGKFKRAASQFQPLSEEGRAMIQEAVDHIFTEFVDDVAEFRGTTVDDVLQNMADGRVFLGQQAIDRGFVDGFSTLPRLVAQMSEGEGSFAIRNGGGSPSDDPTEEEISMEITIETIRAEHPDIAQALIDEGVSRGADAERERIRAVQDQLVPGHEALIEELKWDGKTSGPEAAVKVLAADKAYREKVAKDMDSDAPNPPPQEELTEASTESLPVEERCRRKWDADPKLRAEFFDNFERYVAYERNAERRKKAAA